MRMPRVGFWGMGGIGKTVTGAAIVRDEGVRLHFHAIIWLPLGQTPVISKLQNLCHMQCTGKELTAELSSEEKMEALQQAMKGKRVLLCLDDLWEVRKKRIFWSHSILQMITLPRQARDKHREHSKGDAFFAGRA